MSNYMRAMTEDFGENTEAVVGRITFQDKIYSILGLKRESDVHHAELGMYKLAESIARLHELVESIDARVAKLEREVQTMQHSLPGGY
jgi:hypothetical protein